MLPMRATGLCKKAQKRVAGLVWKAQRAGKQVVLFAEIMHRFIIVM